LKIKRNCIVRQSARSTFCWQITRSTFHSVFVLNAAIRIKIPPFDSELEIVLITDVNCITNSILAIYGLCLWKPSEIALLTNRSKLFKLIIKNAVCLILDNFGIIGFLFFGRIPVDSPHFSLHFDSILSPKAPLNVLKRSLMLAYGPTGGWQSWRM
jgi:hypothetical protein